MQIKSTMRYHLTPVRMVSSINQQTTSAGQNVEKREYFCIVGENRLVLPLWEAVWTYLKKLKMDLPFDPAIPLLGIYPKDPKH